MKKTILMVFMMAFFTNVYSQWQSRESPRGATINDLYSTNGEIFAGTAKGVYKLNADTWDKLSNDVDYNVQTILSFNNNLFAGTSTNGVYRSSDDGGNWVQTSNNLTSNNVNVLSVYKNTIVAGTANGFFISDSDGTQWADSSNNLTNKNIKAILEFNDSLYVGTANGIFISADTASTWRNVNTGLGELNISDLIKVNTTMFAATVGGGVYSSTDNAENWVAQNLNLTNLNVNTLYFKEDTLFAGTTDSLYFAADLANIDWKSKEIGGFSQDIESMNSLSGNLFVGNSNGINKSVDGFFEESNQGMPRVDTHKILEILDSIYLTTTKGVYVRKNESWQVSNSLPTSPINNVLELTDSIVYVSNDVGLYVSKDTLKTWNLLFSNTAITGIVTLDNSIIISTNNNGIYRSDNEGVDFLPYNIGLSNLSVIKLMETNSILVAYSKEGYTREIYVSKDKGGSWDVIESFVAFTDVRAIDGQLVLGSGYEAWQALIAVYDLENDSLNIRNFGTIIPTIRGSVDGVTGTQSIWEVDTYNDLIFCSTNSSQVIYSDDLGVTWRHIGGGFPEAPDGYQVSFSGRIINTFPVSDLLFIITNDNEIYTRDYITDEFDDKPIDLEFMYEIKDDSLNANLYFTWQNPNNLSQYYLCENTEREEPPFVYEGMKVLAITATNADSLTLPDVDVLDTLKSYYLIKIEGRDFSEPQMFGAPLNITEPPEVVLSIEVISNELGIEVYPNPVETEININLGETVSGRYEIEIINASGQLMLQQTGISASSKIPVNKLKPGFYFVKITQEDKVSIIKFLKN